LYGHKADEPCPVKHVSDFEIAAKFQIDPKLVISWEPAFKRDVITWANASAKAEKTRQFRDKKGG
jgi:hypothetical protein